MKVALPFDKELLRGLSSSEQFQRCDCFVFGIRVRIKVRAIPKH